MSLDDFILTVKSGYAGTVCEGRKWRHDSTGHVKRYQQSWFREMVSVHQLLPSVLADRYHA